MCYCNDKKKEKSHLLKKEQLVSHIAAKAGLRWSEGLETILKKDEFQSLSIPDNDGLLPFMIAAAQNRCDLSTIYEIILSNPEALLGSTSTAGLKKS
jgi:hypothetical protein